MIHQLKIKEAFAYAVYNGAKTFEIRYNDRGFQAGDYITFQAVTNDSIPLSISHPINDITYKITYVLGGWGLKENYVVLAIEKAEI